MTNVRPGAGALLTKYLLGLLCLVGGLALVLLGVFNHSGGTMFFGACVAALGVLLITLKIMARNRPLH